MGLEEGKGDETFILLHLWVDFLKWYSKAEEKKQTWEG